jgi:hypothetical protein
LIGGCPPWAVNVHHVPFPDGSDKWKNISDKFKHACRMEEISETFIYTEDDYFILADTDLPAYVHEETLAKRVARYDGKRKRRTGWSAYLGNALDALQTAGVENPLSYDLHIPMLVDRKKVPLHLDTGKPLTWRSMAGNHSDRPPVEAIDVKVSSSRRFETIRKSGFPFLSSSDHSFGKIGVQKYLASLFPEPCEYEREPMFEPASPYDQPVRRLQYKKDRLARRVTRTGETLVKTETGWIPEPDPLECVCGFEAKSAAGLSAHQRAHSEEE